jgi:hypothetical protein
MISFHDGQFIASWKNSPTDEDQAGQRVLYSQSLDGGVTWSSAVDESNSSTAYELFPSMASESNPAVALFAEPALVLNNRLYVAASPKQFCLYPATEIGMPVGTEPTNATLTLLLRSVLPGLRNLGPLFWASDVIPPGLEDASSAQGVLTLDQTDNQTQTDLRAFLSNPGAAPGPCADPSVEHTTKCEWCEGGCQVTDYPAPLENERAHYVVPNTAVSSVSAAAARVADNALDGGSAAEDGSSPSSSTAAVEMILYRSRILDTINHLYASTRVGGPGNNWSDPVTTNLADDVSNINAGSLPDGRVYLLNNAMPNIVRDPLYLSVSSDGYRFGGMGGGSAAGEGRGEEEIESGSNMAEATTSSATIFSTATTGGVSPPKDVFVVASCEMEEFSHTEEHPHWGCQFRYQGGSKQGGCQYPQGVAVTEEAGPDAAALWAVFSVNKEDVWVARVPYTF